MRRFLVWTIGLALFVLVLLGLAFALRGVFLAPYLKTFLISQVHSKLGVRISVGSIGGSYLSSLELADVETVEPGTEGTLASLDIKSARIEYFIPALISGLEPFLAKARIDVRRARVQLDLTHPSRERAKEIEPPRQGQLFLPPVLPEVRIRDTSISVRGKGLEIGLDGISVATDRTEGTQEFQILDIQVQDAHVVHPNLRKGHAPVNARLRYSRDVLGVEALTVAGSPVMEAAHIDIGNHLGGKAAFDSRLLLFGGRLELSGRLEDTGLYAQLEAEDIRLDEFFSLVLIPNVSLIGTLATKADLHFDPERPADLAGAMSLSLRSGALQGISVEDVDLKASAADGSVRIAQLDGRMGTNRISLRDVTLPIEAIFEGDTVRLIETASGAFSARLEDMPALLRIASIRPREEPPIPAHVLLLEGTLEKGTVSIATGGLKTTVGTVRLDQAEVGLPVSGLDLGTIPVKAELVVDIADLLPFAALLALPSMKGALDASVKVDGTMGTPHGSASINGKRLSLEGRPIGDVTILASADSRKVVVESLEVHRNEDLVSGQGAFEIRTKKLEDVILKISLNDLAPYVQGLVPEGWPAKAQIRAMLKASGPVLEPEAYLEAFVAEARMAGLDIPSASVRATSSGREIRLSQADVVTGEGAASLTGTILRAPGDASFDVRLDTLSLSRAKINLDLDRPARLFVSRAEISVADACILRGDVGTFGIEGTLRPDGASRARIEASDFRGRGWLEDLVGDRFSFSGGNLTLDVAGPFGAPAIAAKGTVAEVVARDAPYSFRGAFDAEYTSADIRIRQFEWTSEGGQQISLAGGLPIDPLADEWFLPGEVSLDAHLQLPDVRALAAFMPPEFSTGGEVHADIRLTGTWDRPVGHLTLEARNVEIPKSLQPAPPGLMAADCDIRIDGHRIILRSARIDSSALAFSASGEWNNAPSLDYILYGEERRVTGKLSVQGRLNMPDVSWVATRVEGIRKIAGSLDADISLRGPAEGPDITGAVRLSDGEIRPSEAVPSVRDLFVDAVIAEHTIDLKTIRGTLGGSPFLLSGTIALSDRGKPRVDASFQGKNLLFFRNDGVKLRADADLLLRGEAARLGITGGLAITDGRFVKNFDFLSPFKASGKPKGQRGLGLFSFSDPPLKDAVFRVRISTKKPFLIRNNMASGTVRPELLLAGTGEIPIIIGKVYVDPILIKLPSGRLRVESGTVQFLEGHPDRPILALVASTRMMGYDISMLIEGAYDEPVVTLSSSPPLPDDELLLLVLTGQSPKSGTLRQIGQKGGMNVAVYLGKGLLAKWFGSESTESDESVLDRFELEIGKDMTQRGDETIESQFLMAEGIFIDEDALYITAEKDVFDDFNAGLKIVFRFK